ncbi:MAG: response regulator transcription factor [Burkholderiales bacterium]|nr:response regulator transcription factor [Burkholderiales bacterium]
MTTRPVPQILLVDDDEVLSLLLDRTFAKSGMQLTIRHDITGIAALITERHFDAVVLDGNLPSGDGFELCREIRPHFPGAIVMLTGRDDDLDELMGLQLGADDYMRKPVEPRLVVARVAAHLRRHVRLASLQTAGDEQCVVGHLVVKFSRREALMRGTMVVLTDAEFDLLAALARNAGEVVSRDALFQGARGVEYDGLDRSIDMRISRLRKLLGDDPTHPEIIKTVRGKGYMLAK